MKQSYFLNLFLLVYIPLYADDMQYQSRLFEAAQKGNIQFLQECRDTNKDLMIADEKGNSLIHVAAQHGHVDAIDVLSKPREYSWAYYYIPPFMVYRWATEKPLPILEAKNNDGDTPLHCAVTAGHEHVVQFLLDKKANPYSKNNSKLTPFLEAIRLGNYNLFGAFLADGIDVLECNIDSRSVLEYAIEHNRSVIVNILAHHPQLQTRHNSSGLNSLGYAIKHNKPECVEVLANHSKLRDQLDKNGFAAIHYCAQKKDKDLFSLLKEKGADINQKDRFGKAPLNYAYEGNDRDWKQFLIKQGNVDLNVKDNQGRTELYRATACGNKNKVKELLEDGLDPNQVDHERKNSLHCAVERGLTDIVDLLLAHGVKRDAYTEKGLTEFALAVDNGHIDIAKKLAPQSNINTFDIHGHNCLLRAAWNNNIKSVNYALEVGIDPTHLSYKKNSVLHAAASVANPEILQTLLKKPQVASLINDVNHEGKTPLHNAACNNRYKAAEVLLAHGAVLRAGDAERWTPTHNAAARGYVDIIKLFRQHNRECLVDVDKDGNSPLNLALLHTQRASIPELIHPAIINHVNNAGYTPIHLAITKNLSTACVEPLLEGGADVTVTDKDRNNCAHLAVLYAGDDVQNIFVHNARLINQKNVYGLAPIHTATTAKKERAMKNILKSKSLNINLQTSAEGATALALAAGQGSLVIVEDLIAHRAHLNIKTVNGYTPLAYAAQSGHLDCIKRLEAAGALLYEYTNNGQHYLHIASHNGHKDVVDYYLQKHFPQGIRDRNGNTEFGLACLNGHAEVIKLFEKDELYHLNGDVEWGIAYTPRQHYDVISRLTKSRDAWAAECKKVFDKQTVISDLMRDNRTLYKHAIDEYGTDIHRYVSSGYEYEPVVSLETILKLPVAQRDQLHKKFDTFYTQENHQKTLLRTSIERKKEMIQQLQCEREQVLNTQYVVNNLIVEVKKNIVELTKIRSKMPTIEEYQYNPCDCEGAGFYSKEKIGSLNSSECKAYMRTLLQCQNHVAQEKTKTEQRVKQAREKLQEHEERKKREYEEALKADQREIEEMEAALYKAQQAAQTQHAPKQASQESNNSPQASAQQASVVNAQAAEQKPQEIQQDANDRCCYCLLEEDEVGKLFRIPCATCKIQSFRVCAGCVEGYNIKSGQVKCPTNCGACMTDFSVFAEA